MLIYLGEGVACSSRASVSLCWAHAGLGLRSGWPDGGKLEDRIAVDDGGRGLQGLGLIQAACYKLIHT